MDQTADNPSSLDGESSTGTGLLCYMALDIFLQRKMPGFESHSSLLLRPPPKKKKEEEKKQTKTKQTKNKQKTFRDRLT